MTQSVNDKSTAWLTVSLFDRFNNPSPPSSVIYRIDCLSTGQNILAATTINGPGASFDIQILAAYDAILNAANSEEIKRLTITAIYGSNDQLTAQYDWIVVNLPYIN